MELIMILIKAFVLAWFITRFEPLQLTIDLLPNKLVWNMIKLLTGCLKCVSFWTTLFMTGDIFIASGMAMIGLFYDKLIGPIENKVRL